MSRIATLGPTGTFTELASLKYMEVNQENLEISFYPTIPKVFNAIGNECNIGIIPIENTLDGYVQRSLDLLLQTDLQIIQELIIPIQFAFVGNATDIEHIEKVYVQFKSEGQCCKFLEQFSHAKIVITESNGESFEQAKKGVLGEGAIIPRHMFKEDHKFLLGIENVTDSKENETRFIVLSRNPKAYNKDKAHKTSMVIVDSIDEPGMLAKILNEFAVRNINLKSIMSRPTKKALGKYNFFIDVEGKYPEDQNIREAIEIISDKGTVRIIGSYCEI